MRAMQVTAYSRIRRQQLMQEAEGYLDLIMVTSEASPMSEVLRDRLAERAIETLDRLDHDQADHPHAHYLRGQAFRLKEDHSQAIFHLRKAADLESGDLHIQLALAWCYKRVGRVDSAIEALEEALEYEPTEGILHYNLACYWSLAKNVGLTLAHLAKAFELDTNYRDLVAEERDFDPVRTHPEFQALTSVIV